MTHPSKDDIETSYEKDAIKIITLLNPYIYKDINKRLSIEIAGQDDKPYTLTPTIIGLIGFINGSLHCLEHQEKINYKEN